jgi:hypothetical protein
MPAVIRQQQLLARAVGRGQILAGAGAAQAGGAARIRSAGSIWLAARPKAACAVLLPAAVLAATLGAGQARGQHLPADARTRPAAAPADEAAVITSYTGYISAVQDAEPRPAARAAAILAGYAAQPYLGHVLAQIAAYRRQGELAWGYVTPHIISVQLGSDGPAAVIRDCQDASNAWLVSAAAGTVVPGSTGASRTLLVAVLTRSQAGRWLVALLAHVAGTCSRVPSPP